MGRWHPLMGRHYLRGEAYLEATCLCQLLNFRITGTATSPVLDQFRRMPTIFHVAIQVCGRCTVSGKDNATLVLFGRPKGPRNKILHKRVKGALWCAPETYRVTGMMGTKVPQRYVPARASRLIELGGGRSWPMLRSRMACLINRLIPYCSTQNRVHDPGRSFRPPL